MSVTATFSLEDRFSGPLEGVRQRLGGFTTELAALGASMVGAQAGLASLTGLAQKFFDAFARGKELLVLSRQTGESVSDLVVLGKALRQAGLDSGMTGQALWQLQRAMGGVNEAGEPTKHIFAQLGLNLAALQKESAAVQLQTLATRMAALHTPAERAATAMALFGRSGREMLALLADPGALTRAAKEANGTAELFARNAEQFHRIEVAIDQAKDKVGTFFAAVAAQAAPAVESFVGSLAKLDAIHGAGVKELAEVVGVLLANLRALGDMLHTAVAPLAAMLGGLKGLTQAALSLGMALAEVQIGKWLLGLGQSALALIKNVSSLETETAALGANSSAQIRNAATRAANAAVAAPAGLKRKVSLGGFDTTTYRTAPEIAGGASAPSSGGGFSSMPSAASAMMAANIGVALGLLVQQAIVAYTAHIDAQTDKVAGFNKAMGGGHELAERSQNISSQAEKQELLKQVQEKIALAQAQLGKQPGAEEDFKFYNFLKNQIESVKDADLAAKEAQVSAAARWAAAEEAAGERVGKLYVELEKLQKNLAAETYRVKYEAAGAGGKRQLLEERAQEITRHGTDGSDLDGLQNDGDGLKSQASKNILAALEAELAKLEKAAAIVPVTTAATPAAGAAAVTPAIVPVTTGATPAAGAAAVTPAIVPVTTAATPAAGAAAVTPAIVPVTTAATPAASATRIEQLKALIAQYNGMTLDNNRAALPKDLKGRAEKFNSQAEFLETNSSRGESEQDHAKRLQKAVALREAAKELLEISKQQHALDEADVARGDRTAKLRADAESVSAKTPAQHRKAIQDEAEAELAPLRRKRKASTDKSEQGELDAEINLVTARRDKQLSEVQKPTATLPNTPAMEQDRLGKIGLFVGSQAPALDFQKRTADAVAKLAAWAAAGARVTTAGAAPQSGRFS